MLHGSNLELRNAKSSWCNFFARHLEVSLTLLEAKSVNEDIVTCLVGAVEFGLRLSLLVPCCKLICVKKFELTRDDLLNF